MKKIFAIILSVILTASVYVPCVSAQEDEGWKTAYATAIKQYKQAFGNNLNLADLDIDGTPELIISTYPGTGLFSAVENIFTYKNNQLVKLPNTDTILPDEFTLYQNYGSNDLRLEGSYVVRSGWMYNYVAKGEYYLDNGLKFKEKFTVATETDSKTYKETKTYYLYGNKTKEASYTNELNQYHIGWLKVNSYKSVHSYLTSAKRTESETDSIIKKFLDSYVPGPIIAKKSTDNMTLDSNEIKPSKPAGYNLADRNYYKLRDIAMALKDSSAKFQVKWENNAIYIETGKDYTPVGGELSSQVSNEKNLLAEPSEAAIYINGTAVQMKAYTINNNNYFQIRDLGSKLGFDVDYDAPTSTVLLSTGIFFPLKGNVSNTKYSSTTDGILCDYIAPAGTPLYAPCAGTIKYLQVYGKVGGVYNLVSYGNQAYFTSKPLDGKTYTVLMGHLSKFETDKPLQLQPEQTKAVSTYSGSKWYNAEAASTRQEYIVEEKEVSAGELIGYTGETGNAHGAHLHMEVKENGKAISPFNVFKMRY